MQQPERLQAGLVCIEERCTDEIGEIAGEVPVYGGDAGVDGG
jgi:hypothetical protein